MRAPPGWARDLNSRAQVAAEDWPGALAQMRAALAVAEARVVDGGQEAARRRDEMARFYCGLASRRLLSEGDAESAHGLLHAAMQEATQTSTRALATATLADLYTRGGEPGRALRMLEQAAEVLRPTTAWQREQADAATVGGRAAVALALCCVLSELGRHGDALAAAQRAILATQTALAATLATRKPPRFRRAPLPSGLVLSLTVAYHNAGAELEALGRGVAAAEHYTSAAKLAAELAVVAPDEGGAAIPPHLALCCVGNPYAWQLTMAVRGLKG